ncbi:hypothetical protein ABQ179_005710 [Xanthomonas dyei]
MKATVKGHILLTLKTITSILPLLFFSEPGLAANETTEYCYGSSCFPLLQQAETEMRRRVAYGSSLERFGTEAPEAPQANSEINYLYIAPDKPPTKFQPAGYRMGGWGYEFIPGFCTRSSNPHITNLCADEDEIALNMSDYHRKRSPECSFTGTRLRGFYAEPFYYSSAGGPGYGVLTFNAPDFRRMEHEISCGEGDNRTAWFDITKIQTYDCPTGYNGKWGFNPAYASPGSDHIADWPDLCTAGKPIERVTKKRRRGPSQTPSCPANENPCFPATGDKMRIEPDLSFAGREFSRYYHSLKELQVTAAVAHGWSHTFLERLSHSSSFDTPYLYTEQGYLQRFTSLGNGFYRGDQNAMDRLQHLPDDSWLLIRVDGERRTYSSTGYLQEILSSRGPAYDVALSYKSGQLEAAVDGTGRALHFQYENGLLRRVSLDDGSGALYEYDQSRNLTKVTYQDGSSRSYRYDEQDLAPTDIEHLLTGIFDNDVRYATFSYDALGNVSGSMLHAGSNLVDKTVIAYSAAGQATVTGPLGEVSVYTLSPGPFPQVTGITNSRGSLSSIFDERGRPRGGTDRNGVSTYRDFVDTADTGLLVRETLSSQAGQLRTTEVTRNTNNRIVSRNVISPSSTVSAETSTYNSLGLILSSCRYDPAIAQPSVYECGSQSSAPAGVRQTTYQYCDASGQTGCPQEGLLQQTTARGQAVRYAYFDADDVGCGSLGGTCLHRKGDLQKTINALGQTTEHLAYDGAGRPLSIKDANGIVTDYSYHPRGWLTATKVRGSDASGEADDRITRIDYWPTGLVKQVTQPDGAFTAFTYDAAHRLTDMTDNAGNTLHYTLDNAGNRIKEDTKDAAGTLKRTLSRVYNQLGQLKTQATAASDPTDFEYDANGNPTKVTDALATATQSEYDPLNRLSRTLQDVAGIKADTTFDYDALDNLTKVTDPKGLDTKL